MTRKTVCAVITAAVLICVLPLLAAQIAGGLTPELVRDPEGDGPDAKGNTGDDTWQFWFQVIHDRNLFLRLTLATKAMPEEQRQNGIPGKVWGPVAGTLPNPKDTEGWIYHSDWDGKREGVWGDTKAKQILVVPYQEKNDGGALAITYKVPADGKYVVSGKAADLEVDTEHKMATGVKVWVDVVAAGDGTSHRTGEQRLIEPIAIGDKAGPESAEFASEAVQLKAGQLVRLVVDPVKLAHRDVTRIEFNVTPAK